MSRHCPIVCAYLAATCGPLAGSTALHLVVIREEEGVALVPEGQAQNSLGVGHSITFAISHLLSVTTVSLLCIVVAMSKQKLRHDDRAWHN